MTIQSSSSASRSRSPAPSSLIVLALFVVFLGAPGIAWLFGVEGGGNALENKAVKPAPRPTIATLSDASFGKAFSDWVWDSVPLRDTFLHLDHAFDSQVLGDSPVPTVLFGERGFAFARERVLGAKAGGTVQPAALIAAIDRVERAFAKHGMRVIIIVSPNKATIHEDALPAEYAAAHRKETAALLDALRSRAAQGGALIDLHGMLLDERARLERDTAISDERLRSVFRRMDQHWSLESGRVQARAIVDAIDATAWSESLAPAIVGPAVEVESELSTIYLKTGQTEPYAKLETKVPLTKTSARQVHEYTNDAPAKPLKVAVVRDSFLSNSEGQPRPARDGGFETIASFFKTTSFVHWDQVFSTPAGERALRGADVCVIQIYEGNLAVFVRNPERFEALLAKVAEVDEKK